MILNQDILLVRPKPLPDELLTSWLVRLAWSNGQRLGRFWMKRLGGQRILWHMDPDRGFFTPLIQVLADKTNISFERAIDTTFRTYEGKIFESFQKLGMINWILPIRRNITTWANHGQQYCPQCLITDENPYFRRRWRLSFSVVCPEHRILLLDSCYKCGGPVTYHESEFINGVFSIESPITRCPRCGADYREGPQQGSSAALSAFQATLYDVMNNNYALLGHHHPPFPHLFFDGFHQILHTIGSNGEASRLRLYLDNASFYNLNFRSKKERFEELRLQDRERIMGLAVTLIQDWPNKFIETCCSAKVVLSHLIEFHRTYPFWYESVARNNFNKKWYHPVDQEYESAKSFLIRKGKKGSENQIRRLLGLHFK